MNTLSYKTRSIRTQDVEKAWFVVDAEGIPVGRLASAIALVLKGKHKTSYTPHVNNGDNVIVVNAEKVRFTGNKWAQKEYLRYSGYTGGLKSRTATEMLAKKPTAIVEKAVKGMLPKNKLGRDLFRSLFVYTGKDHPHAAQNPQPLKF